MSPTAVPPNPLGLPLCPVCGEPVESITEHLAKAPTVEPCGDDLTPEQAAPLFRKVHSAHPSQ